MLKKSLVLFTVAIFLAFTAFLTPPAVAAPLYTYTVDSNGDQPDDNVGNLICHTAVNTCTLRAALQESNAAASHDNIVFNISPGGLQTIQPGSALPGITDSVTLDAATQPGCSTHPCIELSGSNLASGSGFTVSDYDTLIRGFIINSFMENGIVVNAQNVVIRGNFIGTDVTGTLAVPNQLNGILLQESYAIIGGTAAADRNVISGNTGAGILFDQGPSTVQGNYIGTNAAGSSALGNAIGISSTGYEVIIGGSAPGAGNLISGNKGDGIAISDLDNFNGAIQGNWIGTDASGTAVLGNSADGIHLTNVQSLDIGGIFSSEGNVISGNSHFGIHVEGDSSVLIAYNYIGTDHTGTSRVSNDDGGIESVGALFVQIVLNVISGNNNAGISINGDNALIVANKIGTTADGAPLGNPIGIALAGSDNSIGTQEQTGLPFSGNVIAYNLQGIGITSGSGNLITGNSIYDNVFANLTLAAGANNDQSAPTLTFATQDTQLRVRGTVEVTANTDYTFEFFASPDCGSTNDAPGETFLTRVTTSFTTAGTQPFDLTVDASAIAGQVITATLTEKDTANTGGFSNCIPIQTPETSCDTAPSAPASLLPPNGANVSVAQVPLDWSDVQCTTKYNVVVRQDTKTGPKIVKKAKPTVSNLTTPALTGAHNYVWRVRSCNDTGCGPWTAWQTFRVKRNATH